jgi:hypothetical protein
MRSKASIARLVAIATLVLTLGVGSSSHATAQGPNRVGLIVVFGDGSVVTSCIAFSEAEISGYEALKRTGLSLVTSFDSGMGAGICKIEDQGCPKASCMTCDAPNYWSYWHLAGNSWSYSQLGASSYTVQGGAVEGWRWGTGDPPPMTTFDQICAPPTTDTPVPTNTPMPPTETPIPPTNTPAPTDTPGPTPVPAPEAWFRLDDNPIATGSCTMLRWDTSNAQGVYLDGEGVAVIGSQEVCPVAPTDYELRVVGPEEERTFRLTLGVTGSPATATATAQPTAPSPSPTVDTEAATQPPSPTPQAVAGSSPSPTATASRTAETPTTSETAASLSPSEPGPASPTATPAQVAQTEHTATAVQMAEARDSEDSAVEEKQAAPSTENDSPSPLLPIGTIAFSLIVGGLVGWLIYIVKLRGRRA